MRVRHSIAIRGGEGRGGEAEKGSVCCPNRASSCTARATWPSVCERPRSRAYRNRDAFHVTDLSRIGESSNVAVRALTRVEFSPASHGDFLVSFHKSQEEDSIRRNVDDIRPLARPGVGERGSL